MTYTLARKQGSTLVSLPKERNSRAIRRVFNNDQIIERFEKWLLICGKRHGTRVSYKDAARQFASFLVDKPLTAASKEDFRGFLGNLYARGLAAATIQARLHGLRALCDCLQLGGQVRASVARQILSRKLPRRLPRVLSEDEVNIFIGAARTPRERAFLELGYASGLRVAELANLRVEDVNLKARSLIVIEGKWGNDRVGLFGRPAAAALREYIGDRTTGYLFVQQPRRQRGSVWRGQYGIWFGQWRETDKTGKRVMRTVRLGDYELSTKERARDALDTYLAHKLPQEQQEASQRRLTTHTLYRIIVKVAKRAGLTGVHPHTLRHSMATHCLNHGMDIRHVQELLGHTGLGVTQKYLHLATEDLQRVHAKFSPRG